jgi:hypothetical protein
MSLDDVVRFASQHDKIHTHTHFPNDKLFNKYGQ